MDLPAPHGYRRLYCTKCGYFKDIPIHCTDRTCVPCNQHRAARIYSQVKHALTVVPVDSKYRWRHIMLSVPNQRDLGKMIHYLIRNFRKLRNKPQWKYSQYYGYYVIEITGHQGYWHAHFHVISYGKYLHWEKLYRLWSRIIRTRTHIWVTQVRNNEDMARYVAKYVSKGSHADALMHKTLNLETKNCRLFSAWGKICKALITNPAPKYSFPCPQCGNRNWLPDFLLTDSFLKSTKLKEYSHAN